MQGHNQNEGHVVRTSDSEDAVATSAGHETPAKPDTVTSSELPVTNKTTSFRTKSKVNVERGMPDEEESRPIELHTLLDNEGRFRPVQVRETVDQETVDTYAEAMKAGKADEFPPIEVFEVTDRHGERYIAAGLHRCTAARQAELTAIKGHIRGGTWHEALHAAIKTNATHGHRPTMGDVCETVVRLREDAEYRTLNNSAMARFVGVSESMIRNALRRLEEAGRITRSADESTTVVRKDGTVYQLSKKATTTSFQTTSEGNDVMPGSESDVGVEASHTTVSGNGMPYHELLTAMMAQVKAIGKLVDEQTPHGRSKGLTPEVLAALATDLNPFEMTAICHGGTCINQLCEHLRSRGRAKSGRKAA